MTKSGKKVWQCILVEVSEEDELAGAGVKWVAADNIEYVKAHIIVAGWKVEKVYEIDVPPTVAAGCDAIL